MGTGAKPKPIDGAAGSVPIGTEGCVADDAFSCVGLSVGKSVVDAIGSRGTTDGVGSSPPMSVPVPTAPLGPASVPVQKTPLGVVNGMGTPAAVFRGESTPVPVPKIPAGV